MRHTNPTPPRALSSDCRNVSTVRRALLPLLTLAAAVLLSGCTSRSILRMDGRYEKARLPNHFDRDADSNATVFSVTASKSQKEFIAWQDSGSRGRYTFSNASYGVDLSLLGERGDVFFGGYLGASPEPGNLRIGGFLGTSQRSGNIVGSMSLGAGFNVSVVDATYEDIEWLLFFPVSSVEGSESGGRASFEVPFRAGLLYDLGALSPYVSTALNYTAIGIEGEKQPFLSGEAGLGLEVALTRSLRMRGEAVASNTAIDGHWTGPLYGVRLDFASAF